MTALPDHETFNLGCHILKGVSSYPSKTLSLAAYCKCLKLHKHERDQIKFSVFREHSIGAFKSARSRFYNQRTGFYFKGDCLVFQSYLRQVDLNIKLAIK